MTVPATITQIGTPRADLLSREVEVAIGANRHDKNWRNIKGTLGQLLALLAKHEVGEKDGRCITQGCLAGPQRVAKNAIRNHILMLDIDNGTPREELIATLVESNLFGVVWTTYSHGTTRTEVGEDAFNRWAKKLPTPPDDIKYAVCEYLKQEKRYTEALLDTVTDVTKDFVEGGVKYLVTHAPMDKCRVLFLLDQPFKFGARGGSQMDAIQEWKDRYAGVSVKLGIAYDRACVDPSRLMYLPRVGRGTDMSKHSVTLVWGDTLTEDRMPRVQELTGQDIAAAFTDVGAGIHSGNVGEGLQFEAQTPGLLRFAAKYGRYFEAVDWLQSVYPDGVRGHPQSGGIEFQCPNEDGHSEQKADDRAFWVRNASENEDGVGFTMGCLHNTCKTLSDGDRLWYLDLLCRQFGVTDAMQLREWCPGAGEEDAQTEAKAEKINEEGSLEERIARLTASSPSSEYNPILRALVSETDPVARARLLEGVRSRLAIGKREINAAFRAQVEAAAAATAGEDEEGAPQIAREPLNLHTYNGPISCDWHYDVQNSIVKRMLETSFERDPRVFVREEGGVYRIVETDEGVKLELVKDSSDWVNVIADAGIQFVRVDDDGVPVRVEPPASVVRFLQGCRQLKFKVIRDVMRIPVFAPDGTIVWKKGYVPALKTYLDPQMEWRDVPETITSEDVDEAVYWLTEAIRDFPFCEYDDDPHLPIKLDEVDADGFPLPNLDRGRSSRVNTLALFMQPFVRAMIDGNCPNYIISKPVAGTGAGYLADVAFAISEGTKAVVQPMSESKEEVKKSITAVLRDGAPIVFIDNIPVGHKFDNGAMAAALTAGLWRDRILGLGETVTIKIKCVWMMAGNRLKFSNEMLRRNVPILLNSFTKNPAVDRVGGKDFKHYPLHPWLFENRANLVWSIHVLVRNWVQQGMKWGSVKMNSFDAWSGVMSGIFEAAQITGFLANRQSYLDFEMGVGSDEDDITLIQALWATHNESMCSAADVMGVILNPMNGLDEKSLGIDSSTQTGKLVQVGKIMNRDYVGRTLTLDEGTRTVRVLVTAGTSKGKTWYRLVKLENKQEGLDAAE